MNLLPRPGVCFHLLRGDLVADRHLIRTPGSRKIVLAGHAGLQRVLIRPYPTDSHQHCYVWLVIVRLDGTCAFCRYPDLEGDSGSARRSENRAGIVECCADIGPDNPLPRYKSRTAGVPRVYLAGRPDLRAWSWVHCHDNYRHCGKSNNARNLHI